MLTSRMRSSLSFCPSDKPKEQLGPAVSSLLTQRAGPRLMALCLSYKVPAILLSVAVSVANTFAFILMVLPVCNS